MDMRLQALPTGGDLVIENRAFKFEQSFYTAIYASLFTGPKWWGFSLESVPSFGCRVEELSNQGYSAENRLDIKAEAEKALAWIVTEGYARSVQCEIILKNKVSAEFRIVLEKDSGSEEIVMIA
jgi:phage gp46-like protein